MGEHRRLGEVLVQLRVLSPGDIDRVLEALRRRHRRSKFGQVAQAMGLAREEQVLAALAVQMRLLPGIERMSLSEVLAALVMSPAGG
jgi:hypothetical protein